MASRVINKGIEQVAIDLLKHHPRNANQGDVEAIKKSLAVNGWYGSVVANLTTKHILAGNHRVMAAKALGWETVPVQWVDVTPEEELRILVVDNRTTRIGQDDTTKITDILAELSNTPIGLDGTGYSAGDLDALIDSLTGSTEPEELLTDPDEVPEEVETRCKPGDLWILGNHRLLCGDSTKAEDVERLMNGATVDAVVTDPPYGTGIDAKKGLGNSSIPMSLIGDHDANLARKSFMQWKSKSTKQIWWGANYFSDVIDGIDSWIVWDKDHHGMTFADAELAYCSIGGPVRVFRHAWSGAHKASEKGQKRQHPTQKPVALYTWILDTYIKDKCVVVDPFLGSGSGLIACELFQCKCYGLELDPHYCDVIIQRWENATGKKAVLDGR